MGARFRAATLALAAGLSAAASLGAQEAGGPWPPVATVSVVGYDPATGEVGVAV